MKGKWLMMRVAPMLLVGFLLIAIAACGSRTTTENDAGTSDAPNNASQTGETVTPAETPPRGGTLRVGLNSIPDVSVMPYVLGWETMREKGWEVEPKFFPTVDVCVQAVISGQVDVCDGVAANSAITAVEKGAALRMFYVTKMTEWQLVTPKSITRVEDLSGKKVAYHAPGGLTDVLVKDLAQRYQITPEWMVIPGSSVRAEALLNGQIDATPAEISDALYILEQRPDDFHILVSWLEILEGLPGTGSVATETFLQNNPEAAEIYVEYSLKAARRAVQEPEWIVTQGAKYLPELDPEAFRRVVDALIEHEIWDVNGGLTEAGAEQAKEFFYNAGQISAPMPIEQWADFGPLNRVLERLGRQ